LFLDRYFFLALVLPVAEHLLAAPQSSSNKARQKKKNQADECLLLTLSNLLSASMMVSAPLSTLNGSLLHMPMGAGRSYIPILMGGANCADAEVMYSGGEAMLETRAKPTAETSGRESEQVADSTR
jgi:hypothetical protein